MFGAALISSLAEWSTSWSCNSIHNETICSVGRVWSAELQVAIGSVRVYQGNEHNHRPGFRAPRVLDPIVNQKGQS
jgi:hypothetical protein